MKEATETRRRVRLIDGPLDNRYVTIFKNYKIRGRSLQDFCVVYRNRIVILRYQLFDRYCYKYVGTFI